MKNLEKEGRLDDLKKAADKFFERLDKFAKGSNPYLAQLALRILPEIYSYLSDNQQDRISEILKLKEDSENEIISLAARDGLKKIKSPNIKNKNKK